MGVEPTSKPKLAGIWLVVMAVSALGRVIGGSSSSSGSYGSVRAPLPSAPVHTEAPSPLWPRPTTDAGRARPGVAAPAERWVLLRREGAPPTRPAAPSKPLAPRR